MPLFAVERDFGERRDALFALKRPSRQASAHLQWQRSYLFFEQNRSLCIWHAPCTRDLTDYARIALLPLGEVRKVEEMVPEAWGFEVAPATGGQLYCAFRRFSAETTLTGLRAGAWRSARCASLFPGLHWVRSFWDDANKVTFCFYQALNPSDLQAHAELVTAPCEQVWRVKEV